MKIEKIKTPWSEPLTIVDPKSDSANFRFNLVRENLKRPAERRSLKIKHRLQLKKGEEQKKIANTDRVSNLLLGLVLA